MNTCFRLCSFTETYLGQTSQQASQSVTNGAVTVSTNWGYDTNANDRRLIGITNSGVTRSYTLGYGSGPINPYDIMSITDTAATGHPFATQSHTFTYDDIDRVLTASATTPGNYTYGYDKLDNATTVTPPSGAVTPAPTYNVNNQLATWASNTYAYDANGNTLSGDGTKTYKWDAENRLIEIDYVGSTAKTNFSYDGLGHRRVAVETAAGGGATTTRYLWCGSRICQSRDGSDNVLKRYTAEGEYNLGTSQRLVYMPDQLGSVRDALDAATGTRVTSLDYSPYGAITQSSVVNGTDYQYASLFKHAGSGLNVSATRSLDSVTTRWLSREPLKESAGPNPYSYVGADPISRADPRGLQFYGFPSPTGGGGVIYPSYPPVNLPTPPFLKPSEASPGPVCSCTKCTLGLCRSVTLNLLNIYAGVGGGFGSGCSIVLTNNMQAYSSGDSYSAGGGIYTVGGNSDSVGVGLQTPGFGASKTYSVPVLR